jgi:hypothetical protein
MALWRRADELLGSANGTVSISELYEVWASPPLGVLRGVLTILAPAFALAQRSTLAVYAQSVFRPELDI